MTSKKWTEELNRILFEKGIRLLSVAQAIEVQSVIRKAMESAWNQGNSFDHGFSFHEDLMEE